MLSACFLLITHYSSLITHYSSPTYFQEPAHNRFAIFAAAYVLAALLGGSVLSLGSLVGFLTVLGVAVRNSMVMAGHFQHLEQHEGETFGPELILRGARERLGPPSPQLLMIATSYRCQFVKELLALPAQRTGSQRSH